MSAREDRDPLYAAFVLILVLGLRRGEVLALRWSVVNLDDAEIDVYRNLQRIDGELIDGETKDARFGCDDAATSDMRDSSSLAA